MNFPGRFAYRTPHQRLGSEMHLSRRDATEDQHPKHCRQRVSENDALPSQRNEKLLPREELLPQSEVASSGIASRQISSHAYLMPSLSNPVSSITKSHAKGITKGTPRSASEKRPVRIAGASGGFFSSLAKFDVDAIVSGWLSECTMTLHGT
ncbi:duf1446 domain protein [Paraphaeosphaeria minitans]|uniref:Duf1446 domain protein n=1 Tax=Paraphaeosphaeria minitans TaxID=565426 RepID=A0A9P6GBK8_9PLEO|nr:duf1446 domain protein [Paraphaeosphaeria minitans]